MSVSVTKSHTTTEFSICPKLYVKLIFFLLYPLSFSSRKIVWQYSRILQNISHKRTIYTRSLIWPDFAKQIIPNLSNLCCNDSLVTWTVMCLTAAKFKPLTCTIPVCSFALFYVVIICIVILWDGCLLLAVTTSFESYCNWNTGMVLSLIAYTTL
jgi:hypothetical protein